MALRTPPFGLFVFVACLNSVAGCNRTPTQQESAPNPTTASPRATSTFVSSSSQNEKDRHFWKLIEKAQVGAAPEREQLSAALQTLPPATPHPGKRPWSRPEVLERLDTMVALAPLGVVGMGAYARAQADSPVDNSDPRSAVGGGLEPSLAAFNAGAMLLIAGRARELGEPLGAANDARGALQVAKDLSEMPIPIYANSGGPTDGASERKRLLAELESAVGSATWSAIAADRAKIAFVDNRKDTSSPSPTPIAPSAGPSASVLPSAKPATPVKPPVVRPPG